MDDEKLASIKQALADDPRWVELCLDDTNVTDASVPVVLSLRRATILRVAGTHVTFEGIKLAASDPGIGCIAATPMQVTPGQLAQLKALRPDLNVYRYFPSRTSKSNLLAVVARDDEDQLVKNEARKSLKELWYVE